MYVRVWDPISEGADSLESALCSDIYRDQPVYTTLQTSVGSARSNWPSLRRASGISFSCWRIIGAIAELERNLIVERVKSGLRRAKLEGVRIGRPPANIDRHAIVRDRQAGRSLSEVASAHRISRAMVCKVMKNIKDSA